MGLVTDPFTFTNGTVADATEVNSRFDTLYTLVNGALDAANFDLTTSFAWTSSVTSTDALAIIANSLTTGEALSVLSNSADTGGRSVGKFTNDNTAATGAIALSVQQDSTAKAMEVLQTADGYGLFVRTDATSQNGINVIASSLETGSGLNIYSDSADTGTRFLGYFNNDNAASSGATVLGLRQDSDASCLFIDNNGNGRSLYIDSEATTVSGVLRILSNTLTSGIGILLSDADSLTSGGLISLTSNSADISSRYLFSSHNDNTAATGAIPVRIRQDAVGTALLVENPSGADVFEVKEDGALLLPDITPGSNELVRMSFAKIWGAYAISAATTIATLDSHNSVSVVVASWGAVTVSWGVNKMATTSYAVTTGAGASGVAGDRFAAQSTGSSSRSQLGLNIYDLSVGGMTVTAGNVYFAVYGDTA